MTWERKERTEPFHSSSPSPCDLTSEPTTHHQLFSASLPPSSSPPSTTTMPSVAVNYSSCLHNLFSNLIWNEFWDSLKVVIVEIKTNKNNKCSFSFLLKSRLIWNFLNCDDNEKNCYDEIVVINLWKNLK